MKVTDLKEGEGIRCTTEEECHAILRLMHDAGLKWNSGDSYLKVHNINYLHDGGQVYMPYSGIYSSKFMRPDLHLYPASDFIDTPTSSHDRIMESMVELSKPRKGGLGCNILTGDTDNKPLVETYAEKYARISKGWDRHSEDGDVDHTNRAIAGGGSVTSSSITNPYINLFS